MCPPPADLTWWQRLRHDYRTNTYARGLLTYIAVMVTVIAIGSVFNIRFGG